MGCCHSIPQDTLSTFTTTQYPPDLSQTLGGVDSQTLSHFMESDIVSQKYTIQEGIAGGNHWTAVLATLTTNPTKRVYNN